MKISFLCLHLGFGGVESAICNQANMFCSDYEVEIAVLYNLGYNCPFFLDKRVKVVYLSNLKPNKKEIKECFKKKKIVNLIKECFKALKILYLRKTLMKRYIKRTNSDIILSTRILYNKLLTKYSKKNVIKIVEEHVYHNNNEKYIKQLMNSIKNVDYFLPVSSDMFEFYKNMIPKNVVCCYIPHALDFSIELAKHKINNKIISVGRFSNEKGYNDLLDVINLVKKTIPNIHLDLIGDGEDYEKLVLKTSKLNLNDNVEFYGFRRREFINNLQKEEDLYVMTSFEESFGLVLIEAMEFGIPCIAFDSATGAKEIINGKNGILVSKRNIENMSKEIINLLSNKKLLNSMQNEARKTADSYSFNVVQKKWLRFLKLAEKDFLANKYKN